METTKFWVLKAYPEDAYYGDPLVVNIVFTDSEKNALDERYGKWITENDGIDVDEEGYPIMDTFMYYLGKEEGMDVRDCWEWVYWAEVKVRGEN